MRLVVTGTQGQVAQSLLARGIAAGHQVIAVGRPELDLSRPTGYEQLLSGLAPDVVVSAAAYTAVDKAESEPAVAHAVNADGPSALARAAKSLGVPLVHLSTDYVFAGDKMAPYVETDPVNPLGVYGLSKLAGEEAVLAQYPDNSAVLRIAWVYSQFGSNFVKTMLRLAIDRAEINVVGDQFGNPTSALDIADGILKVASNLVSDPASQLRGVFHMTAAGETSWAGFAEAIFAASEAACGPTARVRAITTNDYPTLARRPANSRLDCGKLEECHAVKLGDWRVSSAAVVAQLVGTQASKGY